MATSSNNIYPGSKVKVHHPAFQQFFPHNVWEVTHLNTKSHNKGKTLFICLPIKEDGTKGVTSYHFTREELELIS